MRLLATSTLFSLALVLLQQAPSTTAIVQTGGSCTMNGKLAQWVYLLTPSLYLSTRSIAIHTSLRLRWTALLNLPQWHGSRYTGTCISYHAANAIYAAPHLQFAAILPDNITDADSPTSIILQVSRLRWKSLQVPRIWKMYNLRIIKTEDQLLLRLLQKSSRVSSISFFHLLMLGALPSLSRYLATW